MRSFILLSSLLLAGCPGPSSIPTDVDFDLDDDGFRFDEDDCNDTDASINPGADDPFGDNVDSNCDGADGVDNDGDGEASTASGGEDCDDADPDINTDQIDIGWNGVDEDCRNGDRHDWSVVGVGDGVTCGLSSINEFRCWGSDEFNQITDAPTGGDVTAVDGTNGYMCAIQSGNLLCWGNDAPICAEEDCVGMVTAAANVVAAQEPGTVWESLSLSPQTACVMSNLGEATCWGDDTNGETSSVPPNELRSIAAGRDHVCATFDIGASINGNCWGDDTLMQSPALSGPFLQMVAGTNHTCARLEEGTLKCWGESNFGQSSPANRKGPYTHLSADSDHVCGIISGSIVECWGRNNFGQLNHPGFSALTVETGFSHSCALNGIGEMFCWGDNSSLQLDVP